MKRKIVYIVLLVMLAAMLAIPVSAAGSASLSASKSTPYRGDTITVTVNVSGVAACNAGSAEVQYGSGLEWTGAKSEIDGVTVDYKLDQGKLIFYTMNGNDVNGKLLVLTFKVKSDAAFASNEIQVSMQLNGETVKASTNITVVCNHKYGSWSNAGASGHNHKCSICGKTESASHTYDNACDTSCNGCGATRSITHSFGEEWVTDETGHWHACTTCGVKTDEAEHIPGEPAGEYTDQICTECEYVLELALGHVHTYDKTYLTDASSHWQKCLGCGEANDPAPHIYSNDCDTTCDTCNYERAVLHNEGEKWLNSTQDHWKVCADCKARLYQAKHQWDAGTVIQEAALNQTGKVELHCQTCGATRVDDLPALSLTQALAWWVWLLIGVVGGMILAVVIGMAIILPQILRKSKGRFAH